MIGINSRVSSGSESEILRIQRDAVLKDVRAKISNVYFFLKILPLKDDELVMSEM